MAGKDRWEHMGPGYYTLWFYIFLIIKLWLRVTLKNMYYSTSVNRAFNTLKCVSLETEWLMFLFCLFCQISKMTHLWMQMWFSSIKKIILQLIIFLFEILLHDVRLDID
jgi:hypothetical protein